MIDQQWWNTWDRMSMRNCGGIWRTLGDRSKLRDWCRSAIMTRRICLQDQAWLSRIVCKWCDRRTSGTLHWTFNRFLYWNMPYGIMRGFNNGTMNHTSPSGSASTPSDVIMTMTSSPPVNATSPPAQPSSLSTELKKRRAIDRAHLFARGEHDQLIKSMNQAERK